MKLVFSIAILSVVFLQADYELRYYQPAKPSYGRVLPNSTVSSNPMSDNRVILDQVKGVIIAPEGDKPGEYVLRTTRGVQIYRAMQTISVKKKLELQKQLDKLVVGKVLTVSLANKMRAKIAQFYEKNGQALVVVNISEQDISNGVVVVTVLEAKLGKVTVSGNKWFSNEWYLNRITLEEDKAVLTNALDSDVAWINNSPWRKASIVYKPGDKYGTTDVDLFVQDERPLRFFVGADNTGFEVTNYSRVFGGINWGNIGGTDQDIAFQYIASPNFSDFQGYMLYYTGYTPWRDDVNFFGVYSHININKSDLVVGTHNQGNEYQFSGRYGVFIPPMGNFFQKAKAGFDWKNTNNDLTVSDFAFVSNSNVTIFQLMGAYEASFSIKGPVAKQAFDFLGEVVTQPWTYGQSMSQAAYNQLRPSAEITYIYARLKANYVCTYKTGLEVSVKARLQASSGPLIPIETFGMGGVNSIRGYVERVVNVDNGAIVNLEVRTPSFSPSKGAWQDKFSGVVFLDVGAGGIFDPLPNQPASYYLAGAGPGFRYDISTWLKTSLDIGLRLTTAPFASSSDSLVQVYFTVIGVY